MSSPATVSPVGSREGTPLRKERLVTEATEMLTTFTKTEEVVKKIPKAPSGTDIKPKKRIIEELKSTPAEDLAKVLEDLDRELGSKAAKSTPREESVPVSDEVEKIAVPIAVETVKPASKPELKTTARVAARIAANPRSIRKDDKPKETPLSPSTVETRTPTPLKLAPVEPFHSVRIADVPTLIPDKTESKENLKKIKVSKPGDTTPLPHGRELPEKKPISSVLQMETPLETPLDTPELKMRGRKLDLSYQSDEELKEPEVEGKSKTTKTETTPEVIDPENNGDKKPSRVKAILGIITAVALMIFGLFSLAAAGFMYLTGIAIIESVTWSVILSLTVSTVAFTGGGRLFYECIKKDEIKID